MDGDTDRQIEAIWTYLSDGEFAINPEGLVPKNKELVVAGKAVVYRNKLWEAGFRGIAVGYPAHVNLAFDAEQKRLALLWKNRFLNVTAHWSVQSMGRVRPAGTDVIQLPHGPTFALLKQPKQPWPLNADDLLEIKFRGYQLDDLDRPAFLYRLRENEDVIDVEDFFNGIREGDTFVAQRQLLLKGKLGAKAIGFLVWDGQPVTPNGLAFHCGDNLKIRLDLPEHAQAITVGNQLRVVIDGNQAQTKIGVQYRW